MQTWLRFNNRQLNKQPVEIKAPVTHTALPSNQHSALHMTYLHDITPSVFVSKTTAPQREEGKEKEKECICVRRYCAESLLFMQRSRAWKRRRISGTSQCLTSFIFCFSSAFLFFSDLCVCVCVCVCVFLFSVCAMQIKSAAFESRRITKTIQLILHSTHLPLFWVQQILSHCHKRQLFQLASNQGQQREERDRKRETERDRERKRERENINMQICGSP